MNRWVVVLVMAGCFSPSVQPGLPCSADGSSPGGQTCDATQSTPICVAMTLDGGGPRGSGLPDIDADEVP